MRGGPKKNNILATFDVFLWAQFFLDPEDENIESIILL